MSQYATKEQLAVYGLTAAALATLSEAEQNAHLIANSAVADGYIGGRVNLPLASWGTDLTLQVCKMTAWTLMSRRGFKPGASDAESLEQGYKDAIAWLKDVSTGKSTPFEGAGGIEDEDGAEPEAQQAPFVVSPSSIDQSVSGSREDSFFGRDLPAPVGTVGTPRLRGWG